MFALGDGLDAVVGEAGGEDGFELEFQDFALELLGALLDAAGEFIDVLFQRGDGLVFLHDLERQLFFDFLLGLLAGLAQGFLDALLDGQFHFAFGIIELAHACGSDRPGLVGPRPVWLHGP